MAFDNGISPKDKDLNILGKALEIIHGRKIRIDSDDRRTSIDIYESVKEKIVKAVKNSPLEPLYCGIQPKGSFFNGLKVGRADEFDVDILLNLHLEDVKIEVGSPGYVKLKLDDGFNKMKKNPTWYNTYRILEQWIDCRGYLDQNKFKSMIESVLTISLTREPISIIYNGRHCEGKLKKCGPAFTIDFKDILSIDFVFVFQIAASNCPPLPVKPQKGIPLQHKTNGDVWYAVPKKGKDTNRSNIEWRLSFTKHEHDMLSSKNTLKMAIRLLKAFRDGSNLSQLCSYHLYTLFLITIEKKEKNEPNFWNLSLGYIFVYMLCQLKDVLSKKKLPFFWDRRLNLLEAIGDSSLTNMHNLVKRIINEIGRTLKEHDNVQAVLDKIEPYFADRY